MTKFFAITFSLLVLALSLLTFESNSYYMNSLINTEAIFVALRVAVIMFVLAYAFNPNLRTPIVSKILGSLGIVLLIFAGITMVSPTLFGRLNEFYPLGDVFIFLQLGIWAKVLSFELPTYQPEPVMNNLVNEEPSMLTFGNVLLNNNYTEQKSFKLGNNTAKQS